MLLPKTEFHKQPISTDIFIPVPVAAGAVFKFDK